NYASRTMRWSGVIVLLFVVFHLADLTWGIQPAAPDGWQHGAVYANFIATFSRPWVTAFYVLAQLALAPHLFHAAWSMFQSMGVNHPRFNRWRRYFAVALTAVIVVPNVIMPLSVLLGFVGACHDLHHLLPPTRLQDAGRPAGGHVGEPLVPV